MVFLVDLGYKKEEILDKNSSLRDRLALIQQKNTVGLAQLSGTLLRLFHVDMSTVTTSHSNKKCTVCMKENKAFKRIIIAIF